MDYHDLVGRQIKIDQADCLTLIDHLNGFDETLRNSVLNSIVNQKYTGKIYTEYILSDRIINSYPTLNLVFSLSLHHKFNLKFFKEYNIHPEINFKNFICSFNGSPHVSRRLLVAILNKFRYFDSNYCSKNFSYSIDIIDGHVKNYVEDQHRFYRKFFISDNSEEFFQTIYSFGHERYNHATNIYKLENKLTQSFIHIVSETLATSHYPFVTEKFLYSIVTRGLFLTYGQPGWYEHLEKYYGFKKYNKLFDYRFDSIQNPVERLVELMSMLSKFSILTPHEWHDLYLIEQDTIEYNYDHYFSGNYLEYLKKYE